MNTIELVQSEPRPRIASQRRPSRMIRGLRRPRLSVNVASASDQILAGLNASTTILGYVNAMTLTSLPALPAPPSWWTSFTTNWTTAQTDALEWVNSLAPDFTAIPQSIVNYNQIFQQNAATIQSACAALQQNGNDSTARNELQTALQQLLDTIEGEQTVATEFATEIGTFSSNLATDATNLNAALQEALQTDGADQQQIANLQSQITSLQSQIASYSQALTAASVAIPVSVFVMGAGIAIALSGVAGPLPMIIYVVGAIGLMASIITVVTENSTIQQAQANISADSAQMSALNQQIAALNALSLMLANIIALSNSAQLAVQAIINAWNLVQTDIQDVLTELQSAESDESTNDWSELASDVTDALTDWNDLQTLVQGLSNVTYNVSSTITVIPDTN